VRRGTVSEREIKEEGECFTSIHAFALAIDSCLSRKTQLGMMQLATAGQESNARWS